MVRVAFSHDGKTILTATQDQVTRSWPVPEAAVGSVANWSCRAQVATGMELEESGAIRILDAAEWRNRRRKTDDERVFPAGRYIVTSRTSSGQRQMRHRNRSAADTAPAPGIYVDRIAGGDRDYRDSHRRSSCRR